MGMTAALKLKRVVQNTRNVLVIEALCVAQALDFLAPMKTSPRGERARTAIRRAAPTMTHDRVMTADFAAVAKVIDAGTLADVLRS